MQVWRCKCPMMSSCSKKTWMKSTQSEEAVRGMLTNHLRWSPCHKLSQEDAEVQAWSVEVESWDEDLGDYTAWQEDEQDWGRKRRCSSAPEYAGPALEARPPSASQSLAALRTPAMHSVFGVGADRHRLQSMAGASSAARVLQNAYPMQLQMRPEDTVTLNGVQSQALLDSLKRARQSVEMCVTMAQRSAAAFSMERDTILECEQVLWSWIAQNNGPSYPTQPSYPPPSKASQPAHPDAGS